MPDELGQPADEQTRDDAARVVLIERSILVLLVVPSRVVPEVF